MAEDPTKNAQARVAHFTPLLGEPVRTYPPIHPGKVPPIEILEFQPGEGQTWWTYVTSGVSDPAPAREGEESRRPRPFELAIRTGERSPWVQALLADLGNMTIEKDLSVRHGQTLRLQVPMDRGISHLTVALFLEDQLPSFTLGDRAIATFLLVGLTEEEKKVVGTVPGFTEQATAWALQRKLLVSDFDRACTVAPNLERRDAIMGAQARFRSWPRVPERLAAMVRAMRSLQKLAGYMREDDAAKRDHELEILADCLGALKWNIVDLDTEAQVLAMLGELREGYRVSLAEWA